MTISFEWKKNEILDLLASCEKEGLMVVSDINCKIGNL